MENYVIFSDVAGDLSIEVIEKNNIHMIPMEITIDENVYTHTYDYKYLSGKDFYNMLRSGHLPVTSQINAYTFEAEFKPILENGQDILYICLSSALSGLSDQARLAIRNLKTTFPNRNICLVDSLAVTGGQGLMVSQAIENRSAGMSLEENAKSLEDDKLDYSLWFFVEDLFHLKRGGRLSSTSALIGSALKIKPILHVANDGKLIPRTKARGLNQVLKELASVYSELRNTEHIDKVTICHADAHDTALKLEDILKTQYGLPFVEILPMSPIIATHVGADMLVLAFRGKR